MNSETIQPKKILVVDDEPSMLIILERLLKREGYTVQVAKNGQLAINAFPKYNPDLVLLDLMMPGMNGHEVCLQIRALSRDTKIIYFSAKPVTKEITSLAELHSQPDGFIAKPATSMAILAAIHSVLDDK